MDKDNPFLHGVSVAVERITDPERLEQAKRAMYHDTRDGSVPTESPYPGELVWARDNTWATWEPEEPGHYAFWEPRRRSLWSV